MASSQKQFYLMYWPKTAQKCVLSHAQLFRIVEAHIGTAKASRLALTENKTVTCDCGKEGIHKGKILKIGMVKSFLEQLEIENGVVVNPKKAKNNEVAAAKSKYARAVDTSRKVLQHTTSQHRESRLIEDVISSNEATLMPPPIRRAASVNLFGDDESDGAGEDSAGEEEDVGHDSEAICSCPECPMKTMRVALEKIALARSLFYEGYQQADEAYKALTAALSNVGSENNVVPVPEIWDCDKPGKGKVMMTVLEHSNDPEKPAKEMKTGIYINKMQLDFLTSKYKRLPSKMFIALIVELFRADGIEKYKAAQLSKKAVTAALLYVKDNSEGDWDNSTAKVNKALCNIITRAKKHRPEEVSQSSCSDYGSESESNSRKQTVGVGKRSEGLNFVDQHTPKRPTGVGQSARLPAPNSGHHISNILQGVEGTSHGWPQTQASNWAPDSNSRGFSEGIGHGVLTQPYLGVQTGFSSQLPPPAGQPTVPSMQHISDWNGSPQTPGHVTHPGGVNSQYGQFGNHQQSCMQYSSPLGRPILTELQ